MAAAAWGPHVKTPGSKDKSSLLSNSGEHSPCSLSLWAGGEWSQTEHCHKPCEYHGGHGGLEESGLKSPSCPGSSQWCHSESGVQVHGQFDWGASGLWGGLRRYRSPECSGTSLRPVLKTGTAFHLAPRLLVSPPTCVESGAASLCCGRGQAALGSTCHSC